MNKFKPVAYLMVLLLLGCNQLESRQALGILVRDRVILTATSSEIITEQPISEGSEIRRGDVLVKLDDRSQVALVAQAKAELASAQANLDKLTFGARKEELEEAQAKVDGSRADLQKAELAVKRARKLITQKAIGQANLDDAEANLLAKTAALKMTKEQLSRLINGTRPEDLDQAKAQVDAARAQLSLQQTRLEQLTITATRDGWLDSLPWNVGERAFSGSPLAILLTSNTPFARVYIPEPLRARVKSGDELSVHIDGVEETWKGNIRWIAKEASFTPYYALNEEERTRLMYLAEIQLPESAKHLPSGLPVQVDLP